MLKFCTLFNSTYLSRGLAMYQSLEQHCADFHLYIFAFDEHCLEVLNQLNLNKVTVVSLEEFENEHLLAVKPNRTAGEYCWTCSSSTIKYCIETYDLDHCTYIDADLLFFSDPIVIYQEMADQSVLITSHRFTPRYDQSATCGVFCVQYITFKRNIDGMTALNWWVDACLEWCYNKFEDNKFGDQKYLDDWETRFKSVHVLQHLGAGIAPWNVQQYSFKHRTQKITGTEIKTGREFDLVFYHYHGFHYTLENSYHLSNIHYHLDRNPIKYIYRPYIKSLSNAKTTISALNESIVPHEAPRDIEWIKKVIGRNVRFFLFGYYKNYYKQRSLEYGFFNSFNLF